MSLHRDAISNYQGTVARTISFVGVGLHSGSTVHLSIEPASPGSGIQFVRSDIPSAPVHRATAAAVSSTELSTCIGDASSGVATIEHLMAAFAGLGVDNALVRVSARELPILDGSSAPFVDKLVEVGVQLQRSKRSVLIPKKTLELRSGDQWMILRPSDKSDSELLSRPQLDFDYSIDFPRSRAIGSQEVQLSFSYESFMELCEARTFCHRDDVELMRQRGLARGGSLDNAVVVDDEGVQNNDGLRYPDEFVRHKLLDCIGDLALLGGRLCGHLSVHKGGHKLHTNFAKMLLESAACRIYPEQRAELSIGAGAVDGLGLAALPKNEP